MRSPYACRRSRIAMRGSRDVSLCSFGNAAKRVDQRRAARVAVDLSLERARRGQDQLIVRSRQRVDRHRRRLPGASGRSSPPAPPRGRCRCASAQRVSSSSVMPSTPAARAAYIRTCQVGCAAKRGSALRRRLRLRRASDTIACAGACQARGACRAIRRSRRRSAAGARPAGTRRRADRSPAA